MIRVKPGETHSDLLPVATNRLTPSTDGAATQPYAIDPDDAVLFELLARFMAMVSFFIHLTRWMSDFRRRIEELFDHLRDLDLSARPAATLSVSLKVHLAKSLRREGLHLSHREVLLLLRAILQQVRQLTHHMPTHAEALRGLSRYNLFCVYII